MFSSISRAIPNSQVTTQFTAIKSVLLATSDSIDFQINGVSFGTSVAVNAGDTVVAVVTAPLDFLYHTFFNYTIDGVSQIFAVANKKAFTFHVIDPKKKWYNYFPTEHTLSFQNAAGKTKPLVFGNQTNALQADSHVVMDDITSSVYFYNDKQVLLSKVELPAPPIDYVQVPDKDAVVVLCFGGEVYEVKLNSTTNQLPSLKALKNYSEYSGDPTYVSRLPGEDIISYIRKIRSKKAVPAGTCLSYDGTYIWAGGNGTVWLIDPNDSYQLVDSFNFDEYAFGIASYPDSSAAVLTTQSNKIMLVTNTGVFTELHQGIALGQPARIGTKIYIPEGETGEILVYNIANGAFAPSFFTPDFSPSYTRVKDNQLYICGNDSEIVLVYDASMHKVKTLTFTSKVTWVSVYNGTVIASHWLKDYKLLLTEDLYRVVPVEFIPMTAPISHVSSNLVTAHMLGEQTVSSYTPPNVTLWINGIKSNSQGTAGAFLTDGDMFSISNAVRVAGAQKVPCVIGDSAFDFVVIAVAQTYFPRYIDFTIKLPDLDGHYSEEFLMPANMKPCLMSIEYGTLLLNGLAYDGTVNVTPSSTITITVEAGINTTVGSGLAPIFTLGQRQFAVPISLNPALNSPTIVIEGGLQPSTPVEQSSVVSGSASLYDFIIPNYYLIVVKKNGLTVTGNYYMQFGQGDTLTVDFVSSYKRFDTEVVYILGSDIFKFVAQNEIPGGINFLSYPPVIDPYVRFYEPTMTGAVAEITSGSAGFSNFTTATNITPIKQYATGNLQVSGILGNTIANLSVSGGDSYFIIDGVLTTDFFANVVHGTNVALARTIQSYFDSNVIITQRYYDIEDDYVEVVVGSWGLVNKTLQGVNFYHEGISAANTTSTCEPTHTENILMDLNAELASDSVLVVNDTHYKFDKITEILAGKNLVEHDVDAILMYRSSSARLAASSSQLHQASGSALESSPVATIRSSSQQLEPSNSILYPASQVMFGASTYSLYPASQSRLDAQTRSLIPASEVEFIRYPILLNYSSTVRLVQDNLQFSAASKISFVQTNIEILQASKNEFVQTNTSRVYSSTGKFTQDNVQLAWASHSEFVQYNSKAVAASVAEFTQANFELLVASRGSANQDNVKLLAAYTVELLDYNYSFSPVARSDILFTNLSKTVTSPGRRIEFNSLKVNSVPGALQLKNTSKVGSAPGRRIEFNSVVNSTPWESNYYADSKVKEVPPAIYQPTKKYFVDTTPGVIELSYAIGRGQGAGTNALAGGISKLSVPHVVELAYASALPSYPHGVDSLSNKIPTKTAYGYNGVSGANAILYWDTSGTGTAATVKEIPLALQVEPHFTRPLPANNDYNRNSTNDITDFVPQSSQNYWPGKTPTVPETSPNVQDVRAVYDRSYDTVLLTVAVYKKGADLNEILLKADYERSDKPNEILLTANYKISDRVNEIYLKLHHNRNDVLPLNLMPLRYRMVEVLPIITLPARYDLADHGGKETTLQFPLAVIDHGPTLITRRVNIVLDREYVWQQDIGTDYGAFVTVADALYAARFYNEFRPELIYETNLYTYRVILDTGLVCKLPRGRYPVAWLLHGG